MHHFVKDRKKNYNKVWGRNFAEKWNRSRFDCFRYRRPTTDATWRPPSTWHEKATTFNALSLFKKKERERKRLSILRAHFTHFILFGDSHKSNQPTRLAIALIGAFLARFPKGCLKGSEIAEAKNRRPAKAVGGNITPSCITLMEELSITLAATWKTAPHLLFFSYPLLNRRFFWRRTRTFDLTRLYRHLMPLFASNFH